MLGMGIRIGKKMYIVCKYFLTFLLMAVLVTIPLDDACLYFSLL